MKKNRQGYNNYILFIITSLVLITSGGFIVYKNINIKKEIQNPVLIYNTKNDLSYKLLLKENNYYPQVIEENNTLIDNIPYSVISDIDTNFLYSLNASQLFNYKYSYKIIANVVAQQRSESGEYKKVLNKDFILKEEKDKSGESNKISIAENVKVDYQYYYNYVADYRKNYPLALNSILTIKLVVNVEGDYEDSNDKIDDNSTILLAVPLLSQTINVTKNVPSNVSKTLLSIVNTSLIKNITWFIIGISMFLIGIIFIIPFTLSYKKYNNKTKYLRKIYKILKDYDEIIVESSIIVDLIGKNIIEVTNFEDLLDAQQELHIPIIYNEIEYNKENWFTITHGEQVWRYIFKNE